MPESLIQKTRIVLTVTIECDIGAVPDWVARSARSVLRGYGWNVVDISVKEED